MTLPGGMGWERRVVLGLVALQAMAAVVVVWSGGLWITNDGPQHLFTNYAALHIDDATLGYARYYQAHVPTTSTGFGALFRLFEPAFGWLLAYRLVLLVTVGLWGAAFLVLLRTFTREQPARVVMALVGFPTAFQLAFFLGFTPFMLGMSVGMIAVAGWRSIGPPLARVAVTAALLYLAARSHVVAAALAGFLLVAVALGDEREAWMRRALLVIAAGVPAGLVFLWSSVLAPAAVNLGPAVPAGSGVIETFWWPLEDRALRSFVPGPWWRGGFVLALAALGMVLGLRGGRAEKALAVLGAVLVLSSLAMPRDFLTWQYAGVRFIPLGCVALFIALPAEVLTPASRRILAVALVLWSAATFLWAAGAAERARVRGDAALATMADLKPAPRRLAPFAADLCLGGCEPEIPGFTPGFSAPHLLGIVLGGEVMRAHAGIPAYHWLLLKEPDPIALPAAEYAVVDAAARAAVRQRLPLWLAAQEAVGLVGDHETLQAFRDVGWVAEADRPPFFVGTFEGCAGRVQVEGGAGRVAHVGAWPSKTAVASPVLDAAGTATLDGAPCGEVWLFIEGLRCQGAQDGLPTRTRWTRGADNVLACVPAP